METASLWLNELPPSDNLRFIGKRRVLSPRAREFYELLIKAWHDMRLPKFKGWVQVSLVIVWPDRRRRDPANLWKCIGDGLQRAGAVVDDCRILPVVEAVYRAGEKVAKGYGGSRVGSYEGGPLIPPAIGRDGGLYIEVSQADVERIPLGERGQ